MGWNNPPVRWSELEHALSGRPQQPDGGDGPAWTRHRERYEAPPDFAVKVDELGTTRTRVPYVELHCHSNFSFLDGASHPEELVEAAQQLGLDGIAITDHDGMYGVVRFAEAAKELGVRTVFGTELSLGLSAPQSGFPDPEGEHLLLLATGRSGYHALCRTITTGQLAAGSEKGRPVYSLEQVVADTRDECVVLTGCRKGAVRRALAAGGPEAAFEQLRRLIDLYGADRVFVELTDHGYPEDGPRNDLLWGMAQELRLPTVATNAVHYAVPARGRLAAAMAAVRARRSLDEMTGWLPPGRTACLRSGEEMARRFARFPGVVHRAAVLGLQCQFDLKLIAPELPPFDVPAGETEDSHLRKLTYAGASRRYGPPEANPGAYEQLEHELRIIEDLGFPGYFLVVHDIVRFCRERDILCQGRGSAANSAVCYALGITNVDAVRFHLLFERFLAPARDGPPDIDLDIESDRREEAIQYVYGKYGRRHAAQVANVISYRARSAIRDVARALGYSVGQQDAWSKQIDRWGPLRSAVEERGIPGPVLELAAQLESFPRHLGIHSGGMVICDRPVSEVCPVEPGRMADRTVLQWDKDDCASIGLVKFDLLGLGMLSALHYAIDLVREHEGVEVDMGALDLSDQNVYDMLCRADSIGVFQVESRAQMATLPRLKPREFYDLVVEVALIRPGPIQGGSVHPYIRRRNGEEKWQHDHPLLKGALEKTLGVPLFQEQLMQIAVDVADFSPAEADELRRAMGAKRSTHRMERLRERFYQGAKANGVDAELAEQIYAKLLAFANFGFPESHALSFAHLVFVSAWFKLYHPAAFCAALLRAQPMGFYSPQSLVADARRHGVRVLGPDVNASLPHATLERVDGEQAVRIGLAGVRTIGDRLAEDIVAQRRSGPFADMADFGGRVRLTTAQAEALATAGAFTCFGLDRREALWAAGAVAKIRPDRLPHTVVGTTAPALPGMDEVELAVADVWAMSLSPDSFPTQFVRERLTSLGALTTAALADTANGDRVLIGGAVTHRQRPATAGGVTFLNIEDETGMVNVVCTTGLWARYRKVAKSSPALLIRGVVEKAEGVISIRAERLQTLDIRIPSRSRDFR
ncbi:error-prone DNA polymerase [Saccharothrix tamanrassetensis]|uniref:Error-prone DNA polymerase n=1 Tax=Saccharothrix tamanrassetensis TaxID=1051531 RepID=A0A841CFK8_9PSEU|nr:error-prone DNA polymerase [Saccharothrix tamanrassetensis]MBB5954968.1 error-prone DNA polymerase [Saccharothrix tamanrassetensis]